MGFFILVSHLHAQEMPIHAATPEIAQKLRSAMELTGHDMQLMSQQIGSLLEMDENLFIANVFMASQAEGMGNEEMLQRHLKRVKRHEGELSEGEKVFAEMLGHEGDDSFDFSPIGAKLVKLYPNDAALHVIAGYLYMQSEKPKQAIAVFQKAVDLKGLAGAYNMMGYAYMQLKDMDKAKASFEAYQQAAPNHANPYDSMGDYYMAIEDFAMAAASFEKAASMDERFATSKEKAQNAREMAGKK